MIRAIAIGILRQVLLVVVGAEAIFPKEFAQLCRRGHAAGRLFVDVDADPPVDQLFGWLCASIEEQLTYPPN